MSSRTLLAFRAESSQGTGQILQLPDIPGQVVEVRSVIVEEQGVNASTAISHALYHNIDQSVVHGINIVEEQWCHFEMPTVLDVAPGRRSWIDFAVPYDLVGPQKWEMSVTQLTQCILTIVYTVRREPNKTIWNELRARTSYERAVPI